MDSLPVYVTRPDSDGMISSYSMTLWMSLGAMMLVWLNIVVWCLIGLAAAGAMIAGALL
jgi:hypothetical protein